MTDGSASVGIVSVVGVVGVVGGAKMQLVHRGNRWKKWHTN